MIERTTRPGKLALITEEQDPSPVVALPAAGLPGIAIAGIATVLAILLFIALDAQRHRATAGLARAGRAQGDAFAPPPALTIPPEPIPAPPPIATIVTTPAPSQAPLPAPFPFPAPGRAPTPVFQDFPAPPVSPVVTPPAQRPAASPARPALVIDNGVEQTAAPPAASESGTAASSVRQGGSSAGSDDMPARASLIGNKATTMPVGTLIPAVLETPIDTARPGLVRAIVSQDTRGFDGRRVLVPRGSRLIGEYQADVRGGQDRVLVTWTRLIRPDGVAIRIGSPAADPLGGAGVPGRVHTFFLERFSAAVLQSALTVGVNLASRPGNGSVIVGLPNSQINNTLGQGLLPTNDLRPKITVKQGAALNVFVARDLDFSGVSSQQ